MVSELYIDIDLRLTQGFPPQYAINQLQWLERFLSEQVAMTILQITWVMDTMEIPKEIQGQFSQLATCLADCSRDKFRWNNSKLKTYMAVSMCGSGEDSEPLEYTSQYKPYMDQLKLLFSGINAQVEYLGR